MTPSPLPLSLNSWRLLVLPTEISDVARIWGAESRAVDSVNFAELGAISATFSATAAALRATAAPATAAVDSIGERLQLMSIALSKFSAESTTADAAAAHAFELMADR